MKARSFEAFHLV